MIMTTLSTHEVPKVQEEIQKIDETAFIVIVLLLQLWDVDLASKKDYQKSSK